MKNGRNTNPSIIPAGPNSKIMWVIILVKSEKENILFSILLFFLMIETF